MKVLDLEKTGTQKTVNVNLWRYVKKNLQRRYVRCWRTFLDLLVFKAVKLITFKRINRPYKVYIPLERCNFVQAICTIFEIIQLHINAKSCAEV